MIGASDALHIVILATVHKMWVNEREREREKRESTVGYQTQRISNLCAAVMKGRVKTRSAGSVPVPCALHTASPHFISQAEPLS